jgi:hypothetical protein
MRDPDHISRISNQVVVWGAGGGGDVFSPPSSARWGEGGYFFARTRLPRASMKCAPRASRTSSPILGEERQSSTATDGQIVTTDTGVNMPGAESAWRDSRGPARPRHIRLLTVQEILDGEQPQFSPACRGRHLQSSHAKAARALDQLATQPNHPTIRSNRKRKPELVRLSQPSGRGTTEVTRRGGFRGWPSDRQPVQ